MKSSSHEHCHDHHASMLRDFAHRAVVSIILTLPILALSPTIQNLVGWEYSIPGQNVILLILGTIVYFYGGWPFLTGLVRELRARRPGMMTLVGVAISVAYLYSAAVALGLEGKPFFWELATLIDIMLVGHYIEMRSVMGTSRAVEALAKLLPAVAHKLMPDGSIQDVAVKSLRVGDRVLIRPGEKVAADGQVVAGESEVNQAALTGESKPISKVSGDELIAGAVNGSGSLTVVVKKEGKDSYLSSVMDLIAKAQASKSRAQSIADEAAKWLTFLALGAGATTLFVWSMSSHPFSFALERMVTVMVIACPHALGLAIPLVVVVISGLAAQNGLLIRNKSAFEAAAHLDTIIFDKTGTLTQGVFSLTDVIAFEPFSSDELLSFASSLEQHGKHALGQAIVTEAQKRGLEVLKVQNAQTIPGQGIEGVVADRRVFIGSFEALTKRASDEDKKKAHEIVLKVTNEGKTCVLVVIDKQLAGLVALADVIRPESQEACKQLTDMGIELAMISGDDENVTARVATKLGIHQYFARVLPHEKAEKVALLQAQGKKVGMVGDGINDAPALVVADVGFAIGAGTDVALESADVVLVSSDPLAVVDVITLSRVARKKMIQNILWASGYNLLTIPLASGVLYSWGILLKPAAGALIMTLSTVVVALNARLINYRSSR